MSTPPLTAFLDAVDTFCFSFEHGGPLQGGKVPAKPKQLPSQPSSQQLKSIPHFELKFEVAIYIEFVPFFQVNNVHIPMNNVRIYTTFMPLAKCVSIPHLRFFCWL